MTNEPKGEIAPVVKFILHIIMVMIIISVLTMSIYVIGNLITGSYALENLASIGALFVGAFALGMVSGSLWYLYGYGRVIVITISTFNFYRALLGKGSLTLLIESYNNINKEFEVPIQARHINRKGDAVFGQWNGINDWKVYGIKSSVGWSGGNKEKAVLTMKPKMKKEGIKEK